jgi:hypothetical protein
MNTKICTKCKIEKTIDQFGNDKKTKDRLSYWCKECISKYCQDHKKERKEYYQNNIDKIKKYRKLYSKIHKKEIQEQNKAYHQEHKVERKEYQKIYSQIHKKSIKERKKNYYQKNKEKLNKQKKRYKEEHKKEIALMNKKYYKTHKKNITKRVKNKCKIDINFKLTRYLRSRLNQALKKNSKSKHTMELLGCSVDFLKKHLESKFTKDMTWNNYGKWHIDHIIPCARFDLSKASEQKKCFNWENLQPLWAVDNLRKGRK